MLNNVLLVQLDSGKQRLVLEGGKFGVEKFALNLFVTLFIGEGVRDQYASTTYVPCP